MSEYEAYSYCTIEGYEILNINMMSNAGMVLWVDEEMKYGLFDCMKYKLNKNMHCLGKCKHRNDIKILIRMYKEEGFELEIPRSYSKDIG